MLGEGTMSDEIDYVKTEFYPVWISSVDHVTTYANAMKDASFREKVRGDYGLPDEFPYMAATKKWNRSSLLLFIPIFILNAIIFYSNLYIFIIYIILMFIIGIILLNRRNKDSTHVPIAFFSSGELRIDGTRISFKARPFSIFMWEYHNLDLELGLKLSPTDITEIGRFDLHEAFPETMSKRFNRKPIRVIGNDEILGGDFLLSIGGRGPRLGKMRKQTDMLHEALVDFKNSGGMQF